MTMVLKVKSRVAKNPNANTQYIAIPSSMALDSQYPFKPDDIVELEIDEKKEILIVRRAS